MLCFGSFELYSRWVPLNLLEKTYFFVKLTGRAMVRPASSDKWKAPFKIVVTFRRVFRIFLRVSCHVSGEQCEGCEWFLGEEAFSLLLSFCQTVLTACRTSCCLLCCCFYRSWSCRSSPLAVLEIHHQSDHDLEKFSPRRVKTMKKSSSFNPSNFSTAPTEQQQHVNCGLIAYIKNHSRWRQVKKKDIGHALNWSSKNSRIFTAYVM